MRGNFRRKKIREYDVLFVLATSVNVINKSNEMFQKVQQRYTRLINTYITHNFIIDQS